MELKKGLNVRPRDQDTVGHGWKAAGLCFHYWAGMRGSGQSSALGRCRDTAPPPEGRISTEDQTDLPGLEGFSAQPFPVSLRCGAAAPSSPLADGGSFPVRAMSCGGEVRKHPA